jgi:hypothetical protein
VRSVAQALSAGSRDELVCRRVLAGRECLVEETLGLSGITPEHHQGGEAVGGEPEVGVLERRKRARVLEPNEHRAGTHPQEVDAVGSLAERELRHENGEPLLAAGGIAPRNGNDPAAERDREAPALVRAA